MPDKYEPGSHNAPGIAGLLAGVEWILERGVESLWKHEQLLMKLMLDGLRAIAGLRVLGPQTIEHRCGVFSMTLEGMEPAELASVLEVEYGILARAGLHCAPRAHESLGTRAGGGATRLSLGPFLTEDDIRFATDALAEIARSMAAAGSGAAR